MLATPLFAWSYIT